MTVRQLALFKTGPDPVGLLDLRHAANVADREWRDLAVRPRAPMCSCSHSRAQHDLDGTGAWCVLCEREVRP